MIDERAEDELEQAYLEPVEHRRIKRLRQQAWLVVVILQDSGMRPNEVFPMRIENIDWDQNRIWVPEGKTDNATRFVPMSDRMKTMLRGWCGSRKEGWVFPSSRSKSGHLTTIAKGFQAARGRAGLDKKLVPYSARHTYGTYTMEKSGNAFAVSKSMGHPDLKSMEPYQHQELEPLRIAINQRNQRKSLVKVLVKVWKTHRREQTARTCKCLRDWEKSGGRGRDRTYDQSIKSRMLYQLSYASFWFLLFSRRGDR